MEEMLNPDHFDSPKIAFSDLPNGMGEKLEVGDTIIAKTGEDETSAEVIEIDKAGECAYLSKELPIDAKYTVKESSNGEDARYDAMKKQAAMSDSSEDMSEMPLPNLKKLLIQISISQGDCNE